MTAKRDYINRTHSRPTLEKRREAEADFREAIVLARTVGEKAWELRATMSRALGLIEPNLLTNIAAVVTLRNALTEIE